jgi:hypothetical protein
MIASKYQADQMIDWRWRRRSGRRNEKRWHGFSLFVKRGRGREREREREGERELKREGWKQTLENRAEDIQLNDPETDHSIHPARLARQAGR